MENVSNTMALMMAFGWQGGTVHQVAEKTGCDTFDIIHGESASYDLCNRKGWFAYRTNSLEFNEKKVTEDQKGNLQFWLGVADAVKFELKNKITPLKKF